MKIDAGVKVNGKAINFKAFRTGYSPGSPIRTFEVTPVEPAVTYSPAELTTPQPVVITVSANGHVFKVCPNGHIDSADDGFTEHGHTNQIAGRDFNYVLMEQGPRRDVIFVPRATIEQIYPHGVKIRTLAGESIVGLPPGVDVRLFGRYGNTSTGFSGGLGGGLGKGITGSGVTDYNRGASFGGGGGGGSGGTSSSSIRAAGAGFGDDLHSIGGPLSSPVYRMIDETEFVDGADSCGPTSVDYITTVPPLIVLIGGGGGGGSRIYVPGESTTGGSTNALVKMIAGIAGFTEVRINTPDLSIIEPFTVSAGSTWYSAIQSLIGPWNAQVFIDGTVLHIVDQEAANISSPGLTLGPDSCKVIRRRISRLPPYRSIDILGTLRRTLRKPMPAGFEISRDGTRSTPHIGPDDQIPYNLIITDSYGPTATTAANFPGDDAINWVSYSSFKKYHINPDVGQATLIFSDECVYDNGGILSEHVMSLVQHSLDDGPHGMIEQDYGRVQSPGGSGFQMIRQVVTFYDDYTEVEGAHATHQLVDGLITFTITGDGKYYKAMPYGDGAASDTIDRSASSLDSLMFGRLQERHEEYHIVDQNVARKRWWEIDALGNRPPRFGDEVFCKRHQGAYDPRQRFCVPVNDQDGMGVKRIYSLFFAAEHDAKLIADRAKRRANKRHQEYTLELTTFLPGLVPGMAIELESVPIQVTNAPVGEGYETKTVNFLSGTFFVKGFDWMSFVNRDGQVRIGTTIYATSQF